MPATSSRLSAHTSQRKSGSQQSVDMSSSHTSRTLVGYIALLSLYMTVRSGGVKSWSPRCSCLCVVVVVVRRARRFIVLSEKTKKVSFDDAIKSYLCVMRCFAASKAHTGLSKSPSATQLLTGVDWIFSRWAVWTPSASVLGHARLFELMDNICL
jgi:hypothetical protein